MRRASALTVVLIVVGAVPLASAQSAEERCLEMGSSCTASEPMNTNTYTFPGGSCSLGESVDFGDSEGTGAKEVSQPWVNCSGIAPQASSTTDVRLPTGTSRIQYVPKISPVSDTSVHQMEVFNVPAGTKRHCIRTYRKFSANYQGFSACGANKQQEFWFGDRTAIQLSESGGPFNLWAGGMSNPPTSESQCTGSGVPYACCYGPNDGCKEVVAATGDALRFGDCKDNWCRQEICISGSDVTSGQNLTLSGYVTQVGTGTARAKRIDYPATPVGSGVGTLSSSWVATGYRERCANTSDGYFYLSHAMAASWPSDSGQFIGAAAEVEGGGSSTAPPPVVPLAAPVLLP